MKYSRQRELIWETVTQNLIHPTADTIYALAREQEPNISLGTVYRNLNQLLEQGVLLKISLPNLPDRFDGRSDTHHHMLCEKCGKLFDIELAQFPALDQQINDITDFTVTDYQVLLRGICGSCSVKH